MKNVNGLLKSILLFGICFAFLSFAFAANDWLPEPKIQAGIAKLTGKVTGFHLKNGEETPFLTLYVPNPVTAIPGKIITKLKEDGSFNLEIPVECNTTIGTLVSDLFNGSISFTLSVNQETKLEITLDESRNIKANTLNRNELTSEDLVTLSEIMGKMIDHQSPEHIPTYTMLIEDFIPFELKSLERKLNIANNDSLLSKSGKIYITNEFKLVYLKNRLFDYKSCMKRDYMRYNDEKQWNDFIPHEPGKSYYTFLNYFKLNNPTYLYNGTYPEVLQTILSNKTLNIPSINDSPVNDWLKEVKKTMAELIGSDTGLFYDLLTANAYARQFNNEIKPLSDKQKENIQNYFKKTEITKIILKKNEEVTKSNEEKKQTLTFINKTPAVSKESLMKAIISKYKGKAVLVDFWATWCRPCMDAMKEIREVKREMHDKEIVFVYITTVSSPQKLWEEKTKIIGGEHYYLTKNEWDYELDSFGFTGIPTYLFYDKNGALKNKITGYPGTEKMGKMIRELLP